MVKCVCVLLLFIFSTHGRVAFHDKIPNNIILDVLVEKVTNTPDITSVSNSDNDVTNSELLLTITKDKNQTASSNNTHQTCVESTRVLNRTSEITDNVITELDNDTCNNNFKVDNGSALILTPFIEEGRIDEARKASRVNSKLFFDIESYSGFLTVNKTYDSNLFFWYLPVEKKPVNETPWIIWLQGGPGVSSLTGLFDEIGPFKVEFGTLKKNPYTWLQNHSLVFIDNPVGAGYSFTKHKNGYARDMPTYSKHLYVAFKQLLQIFPELRTAPLYIAGESYAGKYVPAFGVEIHRHQNVPGGDVNLQGFIIGNAFVDPEMITQVTRPLYNFGLLDDDQINILKPQVESFKAAMNSNRSVEAKEKWGDLVSNVLLMTHQKQMYNLLQDDLNAGKYAIFLRQSAVKRALHVGDIKFSFVNFTVNERLAPDFAVSTKPLFEELLDRYKLLAYCGQLDLMIPCVITAENHRTWKWNASREFLDSTRYPYYFNKKLSGYYKSGGRFTEVMIRNAGHMAAQDAPGATQALVTRWTHGRPLTCDRGIFGNVCLQKRKRYNTTQYLLI